MNRSQQRPVLLEYRIYINEDLHKVADHYLLNFYQVQTVIHQLRRMLKGRYNNYRVVWRVQDDLGQGYMIREFTESGRERDVFHA